jgi:RNA polymerase sigma factor (sigma-70 family)
VTSHEGTDDGADALLANLLARIADGDEAALRALYDRTAAKLLGIILRIQRDRSLAEDVLQDVYLRIWHAAGSYVPTAGAPLPWLCAIARNRAIDGVRRRSEVTMPSGESGEAYWERLTAPGGEDAILDRRASIRPSATAWCWPIARAGRGRSSPRAMIDRSTP